MQVLSVTYKVQMIEVREQPCSDRKYHIIAAERILTGLLSRMPSQWASTVDFRIVSKWKEV